jgi:hypothetical protein
MNTHPSREAPTGHDHFVREAPPHDRFDSSAPGEDQYGHAPEALLDDVPRVLRVGCLVRHHGDVPGQKPVGLGKPDQPCLSDPVPGRHRGAVHRRTDRRSVLLRPEGPGHPAHRRRRAAVLGVHDGDVRGVLPGHPCLHDPVHADAGAGELRVVPPDDQSREAVPGGAGAGNHRVDRGGCDHRLVGLGTGGDARPDLPDGRGRVADPRRVQLPAARHPTDPVS